MQQGEYVPDINTIVDVGNVVYSSGDLAPVAGDEAAEHEVVAARFDDVDSRVAEGLDVAAEAEALLEREVDVVAPDCVVKNARQEEKEYEDGREVARSGEEKERPRSHRT